MNWDAISAIAEIVGALTVIASLIFVGWQLLQNTDAIKTSTSQSHIEAYLSLNAKVYEGREFASVYHTGLFKPEDLDEIDRVRFIGFVSAVFRFYETSYVQYRKGKLDRQFWDALEAQLSQGTSTPGFSMWWSLRESWYSEEFRNLVNEKVREGHAPLNYSVSDNESAT